MPSAHHRHHQLPVPWPVELAEVDGLPEPERELSALDRNGLREPEQGRLGVRMGVAFLVLVVLLVARYGALQGVEDVGLHVGVGVLVQRDRAGGVSAVDGAEAGLDVARGHHRANALGDVDHLLLLGGGQLDGRGVQHQSPPRYSPICHSPARSCTSFRSRGTVNSGTPRSMSRRRSTSRRSRSARMACSVSVSQSRSDSRFSSLICASCSASSSAARLSGPPCRRGSRCTRLTTTAAVRIPSFSRARWKKSASCVARGFGLVTRTKPVCGEESSAFTLAARSLNPSYMPSNAIMNAARSRRKSLPVKRASVRSTRPEGAASRRSPSLPALSIGPSMMRMALLSRTSRTRSGACRKSRALLVGGVSSTTTSNRPLEYSSSTFSMAMYSRLPAMAVESVWYSLLSRMACACSALRALRRTSSSQLRFRLSIIAHISPRAVSFASAKWVASIRVSAFPRAFSPRLFARRRAGSMVRTSARLPSMAAPSARAAAVVVLPTPPEPTQQTILRPSSGLTARPRSRATPFRSRGRRNCARRGRGPSPGFGERYRAGRLRNACRARRGTRDCRPPPRPR